MGCRQDEQRSVPASPMYSALLNWGVASNDESVMRWAPYHEIRSNSTYHHLQYQYLHSQTIVAIVAPSVTKFSASPANQLLDKIVKSQIINTPARPPQ